MSRSSSSENVAMSLHNPTPDMALSPLDQTETPRQGRKSSSFTNPTTPSAPSEFSMYFSKYSAKLKRSSRPSSSKAEASPSSMVANRPSINLSIKPDSAGDYSPKHATVTNTILVDPFVSDTRENKPRKRKVWEPKTTTAPRRPLSLIGINVEALAKGFEERVKEDHQLLLEQQQVQIETLSRRVEDKAKALSEAKKKQARVEEELLSARLQTEKLQEEQAELLEEVQETRGEKQQTEQKVKQLENQIEPLKQKLKDAEDEKRKLNEELIELRAQLARWPSAGQASAEQVSTAGRPSTASGGGPKMIKTASEHEARLWQKQEHIARLNQEIAGYEQSLQELEAQKASWQKSLSNWNRALEKLAKARDLVEQRASGKYRRRSSYHPRPPQESRVSVYDHPEDVSREQTITLLLLTAKMALLWSRDGYKAEQKARQALEVANKHPRNPWLLSRCFYWIGKAQFELCLYSDAIMSLEEAKPHVSVFPEGKDIDELLKEARKLDTSQGYVEKLIDQEMGEPDAKSSKLLASPAASLADDVRVPSSAQQSPVPSDPPRTLEAEIMAESDGSNDG